jgi:hypothetical protein
MDAWSAFRISDTGLAQVLRRRKSTVKHDSGPASLSPVRNFQLFNFLEALSKLSNKAHPARRAIYAMRASEERNSRT